MSSHWSGPCPRAMTHSWSGRRRTGTISPWSRPSPRPGPSSAGGSGGSSAPTEAAPLQEHGQQGGGKQDGEHDEQGSSAGAPDGLGGTDARPLVAPVACPRPPTLSGGGGSSVA